MRGLWSYHEGITRARRSSGASARERMDGEEERSGARAHSTLWAFVRVHQPRGGKAEGGGSLFPGATSENRGGEKRS